MTLELHRHEVVGLIGPNGAGKSTLVNVMTRLRLPRRSGTVELDGPRRHPLARRTGAAGRARADVPAQPLVPRALGAGERRGRRARRGRRPARGAPRAPTSCSSCSGSRRGADAPAGVARRTATSGGSASLGRSRPSRASCSWTSRRPACPRPRCPSSPAVVRAVRDDHDAGVLLIDHNMALIMDVCDRIQVLDQGRTLRRGHARRDPRQPRRRRRLPRRERGARGRRRERRPAVLEVDGLDVRYGGVAAVRGSRPRRRARARSSG